MQLPGSQSPHFRHADTNLASLRTSAWQNVNGKEQAGPRKIHSKMESLGIREIRLIISRPIYVSMAWGPSRRRWV
eukprot:scaffold294661_cov15-Tisochrysis_lutea.AAC.1